MSRMIKYAAVTLVSAGGMLGLGTAHAAGDLYGAIAVGGFRVGEAFDYPTQYAADQAALEACRNQNATGTCSIATRIHNECGVVVERDSQTVFGSAPWYMSGNGPTPAAAEADARKKFGVDTTQSMPTLGGVVQPAFVLDTICTSNAG
ncbi:DUF4189 domain-containing protein [Nocardia acidivorans]|uniref:DUF4189 domain-containing protein n=1 Tax=Nocardia acidivorans TaxID=404580 RepID=UPI000AC576EF|nr:DUF4189 domain-containing protein [Nocardia acidivorans]